MKLLMRKIKATPIKGKIKFLIIVDGYTETWYFQMLKRNEKSLAVDLKPEIPQKKKLKDQYEKVTEQSKHYDKVFWIVDYDVVNSETKNVKKGAESASQELQKYITQIAEKFKNVTVIINNPCLEFWFLLHFENTDKFFDNCEGATKQLKKHLPDYEKTSKYFTKQGNDIYLKLKPKLNDAIAKATRLKSFSFVNPNAAVSQMQLFFEAKGLNLNTIEQKKKA